MFRFHLGLVLYEQNNAKEAAKEFKEAIKLGLGKSELVKASELLQAMKDPAHRYVNVLNELDRALQDQNPDHALSLAKKAQQLMPDSPGIADKMGNHLSEKRLLFTGKK